MANLIQGRFERETEELQQRQGWYKARQGSITKEEEAEYISYCHDSMFRIHILEQRLNRCTAIHVHVHHVSVTDSTHPLVQWRAHYII